MRPAVWTNACAMPAMTSQSPPRCWKPVSSGARRRSTMSFWRASTARACAIPDRNMSRPSSLIGTRATPRAARATAPWQARFLWGEKTLYGDLLSRYASEVVRHTGPEYVQAKPAGRDASQAKGGESRYVVEPNVKDGKGGLRDLQTLFWIGMYFYR